MKSWKMRVMAVTRIWAKNSPLNPTPPSGSAGGAPRPCDGRPGGQGVLGQSFVSSPSKRVRAKQESHGFFNKLFGYVCFTRS